MLTGVAVLSASGIVISANSGLSHIRQSAVGGARQPAHEGKRQPPAGHDVWTVSDGIYAGWGAAGSAAGEPPAQDRSHQRDRDGFTGR
jgi:hypothetical protein